jgi:hypothetical protein
MSKPIKDKVIKIVSTNKWLPKINERKPAGYLAFEYTIDRVQGEFAGCYLT